MSGRDDQAELSERVAVHADGKLVEAQCIEKKRASIWRCSAKSVKRRTKTHKDTGQLLVTVGYPSC
jgi:hypothetical protein